MSTSRWKEYWDKTRTEPPANLLVRALPYVKYNGRALDLGAGSLRDVQHLLRKGFDVTAVDSVPGFLEEAKRFPRIFLRAHNCTFEEFEFPTESFDLVYSIGSLPFNPPESFNQVFAKVRAALKKDGVLSVTFFGQNDDWFRTEPTMSFHTIEEVKELLAGLDVLFLQEEEMDGITVLGSLKHMHMIHAIARRA